MTEWILLAVSLVLVLACGMFVAAEFAFVTVDRSQVEQEAAGGDAGAAGVQAALRSLSTQLSGAQVGITVTNLAIGYLAEPAIAQLVDGPLEAMGVPFEIQPEVGPIVHHPIRTAADVARLRVVEGEEATPYVMDAIRLACQQGDWA